MGLIPAAGRARRLGPLPCSKEVLPAWLRRDEPETPPQPLCLQLLEALGRAGVERAFLVTTAAKWDIPRALAALAAAPGSRPPLPALAYLCLPASGSVPETLDAASRFVAGASVALGFPDVLFTPEDAFSPLLERRRRTGADLVLGLFPASEPRRTDMVGLGAGGEVREIEVRPAASSLRYNWLLAVWSPSFTRFLHREVAASAGTVGELQLGEIFRRALAAGVAVEGVPFATGSYLDVGTPADLRRALSGGGPVAKSQ